jgi:hypothetical protein
LRENEKARVGICSVNHMMKGESPLAKKDKPTHLGGFFYGAPNV